MGRRAQLRRDYGHQDVARRERRGALVAVLAAGVCGALFTTGAAANRRGHEVAVVAGALAVLALTWSASSYIASTNWLVRAAARGHENWHAEPGPRWPYVTRTLVAIVVGSAVLYELDVTQDWRIYTGLVAGSAVLSAAWWRIT